MTGPVIRRQEPTDAEAVAAYLGDPAVMAGTLQLPFPSVQAWRERLARPNPLDYVLLAEFDGVVAGGAGLHMNERPRRRHAAMLGIGVRSSHWGRGIGTALMSALTGAADRWLNIQRIELTVFTDNARAIALYRRFGFVVEGTHRAFALRDGAYADVHAMARLHPNPPQLPSC